MSQAQVAGSVTRYPARVTLLWFVGLVWLGTAALMLPQSSAKPDAPISWLDALFTSTSAACVTGLSVRSTPDDFTFLGQVIIVLLIQIGGIGITTLTTFIVFQLNARGNLRQRKIIESTLGADEKADMRGILRNVLVMTFSIELIGFAILALHGWWMHQLPARDVLWFAAFHSVSAFCNAGFALYNDSLMSFQSDPVINFTIMLLIMLGGLGFPVLYDLRRRCGSANWLQYWDRLQLHTKLMLIGSAGLWLVPAVIFCGIEWDGAFEKMPLAARPMAALFHSVSSRTAGFNSIDLATMSNASLFLTIALMIIGAGACSCAGGFKVTTAAVIVLRAWNTFRGRMRINVFRRTIPHTAVERATATAMLFVAVGVLALMVLLIVEELSIAQGLRRILFRDVMFEVASALGTVGLSTGITATLSPLGKLVIVACMFIGRLGPISVFAALAVNSASEPLEYSNEEPLVG